MGHTWRRKKLQREIGKVKWQQRSTDTGTENEIQRKGRSKKEAQ